MSGLFEGPAPRVRTIPAGLDFLALLARSLERELGDAADPFRLADALVLLPNRRAAGGLIAAFEALGGARLLPAMRPLGDLEDDDPEVFAGAALDLDIPPAIDPLQRRFELARLIRAREAAEGGASDPALAAADDLCRLLDSAAAGEAVDWGRLEGLIEEGRFAAHWGRSVSFLRIVTDYWPQRLAEAGLSDPAARRNRLLEALAQRWRAEPPQTPVVIAGSTGSLAATRGLMQVVSRLPQGCVVLPGLDRDLDEAAWARIDPQHPQHALKLCLEQLGLARGEVPLLAGAEADSPVRSARRAILREALAPADATADWLERLRGVGGARTAREAAQGLTLIEAASAEEEASVCALLLREAFEIPGRSAALVTPDPALARRVEQKLGRWGLAAPASVGQALLETPRGALLALLLQLARDPASPTALAGLLAHPLAHFGLPEALREAEAARWLQALRGPRRHETLAEIAAEVGAGALGAALLGLPALGAGEDVAALAEAASQALELCAPGAAFADADGEAVAQLLRGLMEHGAALGPCGPAAASQTALALARSQAVPPRLPAAPSRLAILGPLEARLQARDLIILGGLNEGTWPAPPPEDGFLNRAMRAELGLPPPEARLGLAAHDFAQLAAAPEVALVRALRQEGAPRVASRWLWRLTTLLKGAGIASLSPSSERDPRVWAEALDGAASFTPRPAPKPRPPASARLRELAITDVEALIRDPYAVYAKRILGLRRRDIVGLQPGARERGSAIHAALEAFAGGGAPEALLVRIERELQHQGFPAAKRREERARLRKPAEVFCAWAAERAGAQVFVEVEGELRLGEIRLFGRADRLDVFADGAEVVDFKTGAPPSARQVASGLTPQLSLEAAILARGGFQGAPAHAAKALVYWRFGGADPGPELRTFPEATVAEGAEEALKAFAALMARYADPAQPYLSKPRVQFLTDFGDYDQLARRREWAEGEA